MYPCFRLGVVSTLKLQYHLVQTRALSSSMVI
uniref:Uncharacterized protein n=1 Tax=Arundo donax TaxID=35708 RepID=A0A0A9CDH8_ARUDO